jgi:GNAT superfamily N-acetyltransferase
VGVKDAKRSGLTTYRSAGAPDLAVCVQFWHDMLVESGVAGSGFVPEWRERLERHFRGHLSGKTAAWFLAEEDGHVVGTAAAFLNHHTAGVLRDAIATLAGVYVAPGHRRRGIARNLTERAIAWCKERSCVQIRLQASQAGRPLYEALGFRTAAEMMRLDLRGG